ncbi:MAG: hypothetical protein ACUVUQ_05150 [Thermodesulfovibrionales bacterium]
MYKNGKGFPRKDSDLDIAVYFSPGKDSDDEEFFLITDLSGGNLMLLNIIWRNRKVEEEKEILGKLAIQRNRFAHRHLNFRWQAIRFYKEHRKLIQRVVDLIIASQ